MRFHHWSITFTYGRAGHSPVFAEKMASFDCIPTEHRLTNNHLSSPQVIETIPSRFQALEGKTIALYVFLCNVVHSIEHLFSLQ
jgi:hypothetical protein